MHTKRRRAIRFALALGALLALAADARAVTMAWSYVGNPGNANDSTGYGAVGYSYNIGTYDVTNSQYVEFLNSNVPNGETADPLALYNSQMSNATYGGIAYNSGAGSGSKYSVLGTNGRNPVNYVTFYDALRFANWLDNGQVAGMTETGAYTLLGGTPTPSNDSPVDPITRNAGATIFLPSENEWYKAAYYSPNTSTYNLYPTGSSLVPNASGPTATPNSANIFIFPGGGPDNLTAVGSYTGTTSPYGAFDMGGDVYQWNEALTGGPSRGVRGGAFGILGGFSNALLSSTRNGIVSTAEVPDIGFRVASVPEPSTLVLAAFGGLALLLRGCRCHNVAVALLVLAVFAPDARAVTMAWSYVGNPGNPADTTVMSDGTTGYGSVPYAYNIGTYDVTNSQYVAFLNSNDPTGTNTLRLYNGDMSDPGHLGGINYSSGATSGSKYSVISGDGNLPVNNVTWYSAIRFANWLDNNQTPGSTETGTYTLLGGTPTPSNANSITRNAGATVFLPSENEWYKAAYYNPATASYYQYATSSNTIPTASVPTAIPNSANYFNAVGTLTDVGAYSGTTSPYGAFDMGGNVLQWNEALIGGSNRGERGGSFNNFPQYLPSSNRGSFYPTNDANSVGFRVASVPEPSTLILAALGGLALLAWRSAVRSRA